MHAQSFAMTPPAWYRQRWPWLLMAGPAIVVVAALFTAWLAVRSDDGVVADDYYKRGLLVNRDIEKSARGAGIAAALSLAADGGVHVRLAELEAPPPAQLRLTLAHPTRAGQDRSVLLVAAAGGDYAGMLGPLPAGRWIVRLESDTWRLPAVEVTAPFGAIRLGAPAGFR